MSQEPKKRHSRARQGKRRHAINLRPASTILCENCQMPTISHTMCRACGFYKGSQVLTLKKAKSA